ncbi:hypothetical protein [Chryseobacterium indoltheticum]|uniref:hypothetical protein n=1 Tax=Chryseobacterium indoltheticum TaxID=254 RepID=UPI003F49942F
MFFKNLFKNKTPNVYSKTDGLSKVEYFEKYQLKELFNLLHQAEELLEEISSENSNSDFLNFKNLFIEEIYELEGDNIADFTNIWNWFQTDKEWNQFTGLSGKEIGVQILNITTNWKIDDDFISGFKVFLDNEYGVILDQEKIIALESLDGTLQKKLKKIGLECLELLNRWEEKLLVKIINSNI